MCTVSNESLTNMNDRKRLGPRKNMMRVREGWKGWLGERKSVYLSKYYKSTVDLLLQFETILHYLSCTLTSQSASSVQSTDYSSGCNWKHHLCPMSVLLALQYSIQGLLVYSTVQFLTACMEIINLQRVHDTEKLTCNNLWSMWLILWLLAHFWNSYWTVLGLSTAKIGLKSPNSCFSWVFCVPCLFHRRSEWLL